LGRQCAYKPKVYLRIAGVTCTAEFGNPPDFFRFNTDDQCSGTLNLSESATGATVFEVCAGATTNVTFTDRTRLNCLPPQEITGKNSTKRWRRFIYGTTNTITGTVLVAGTPQAFPFGAAAAPDISGEPIANSNPPFASNLTQAITIPATAQVGEEFHITMQYWNFCNQFTSGAAPVTFEGIIRVVDQPQPPTAVNQVVCNGTNPLPPFHINFSTGSSSVLWFRDNAGVPGTAITNPNGSNSKDLPVSAFPGGITNTTAGTYKVWASYRAQVGAGTLLCESIRIPVTLTIRESIPTPGPISGAGSVCNGDTGIGYSVPIAASSFPFGGSTEYIWEVVNASNSVVTDVTLTPTSGSGATAQNITASFNIANGTFGGAPSIVRKVRVRRRYTTPSTFPGSSQCQSNLAEFAITVYRNTTAGSLTGGDTKCQGENLSTITWTPGIGSITSWEISNNGGSSYSTIGSFGTSTTVDPTTLGLTTGGTPTTYLIRAQVKNGVCATVATTPVSYTINPNTDVAAAGPDQNLCILAGPLTTTLAGNPPGAATTHLWTKISGPGTVNFVDANVNNTSITVTAPGTYVLRWRLDNGTCNSEDDVQITFGQNPGTPNPHPANFCGFNGQLTADAPLLGEVTTWIQTGGPSTASIANVNAIPSNVTVTVYGTYTFDLKFSSGGCVAKTASVNLVFGEPVTATPEADKVVCVDQSTLAPFAITGTIGGGASNGGTGQGRWEISSGSGTFTSSGTATGTNKGGPSIGDSYTPSATDYANGFVILQLRAIGNICADAVQTLRVDFDKKPAAAIAGPPATIQVCGTTATLNATAPTEGGVGTWSVVLPAGLVINDPTNRNSGVSNLQFGNNVFRWTVNSALGVCASSSDDYTIDRITSPVVNNISPNDLCETDPNSGIAKNVDVATRYNAAITGGAAGVTVTWYSNSARTLVVSNTSSLNVADGSVYYTRVSTIASPPTPVCSSDGVVTFTVNPQPFVANLTPAVCEETLHSGIVNNIDLTKYDKDVQLNLGNRATTWFSDAGLTIPIATPTDVDGITNGQVLYGKVENTITGCFSVAMVTFQVNPLPEVNTIQGPNAVCLDPKQIVFFQVGTYDVNNTYKWFVPKYDSVDVEGGADSLTNFYVLLKFPKLIDSLKIKVQETTSAGCVGALVSHTVKIENSPNSLVISGPNEVCEDQINVEFEVPSFANLSYSWDVPSGSSIILGQGSSKIRVTMGKTAGDVTVKPSTTSGCVGPAATHPVAINKKPTLDVFKKTVCSKDTSRIELSEFPGSIVPPQPPSVNADTFNILFRQVDPGLTRLNGAPSASFPLAKVDSSAIYKEVYENKTGGPLQVQYTVEPVSDKGCVGQAEVLTLVVNPEPIIDLTIADPLMCSGEKTQITLRPAVGSFPADKYIIKAIQNPDGLTTVNPLPPLNTDLNDNAIYNDQWLHPGAPAKAVAGIDITYVIAPKNSSTGCMGDPPAPIAIRIFPKPVIDPLPTPKTICSDDAVNVSVTTSNVGIATIGWAVDYIGPNIKGATADTTAIQPGQISDVLVNSALVMDSAKYFIQAISPTTLNSCVSDPATLTVRVNPSPAATPFVGEVCSDTPNNGLKATVNLTAVQPSITASAGVTFSWFDTNPNNIPTPPQIPPANLGTYVVTDALPVFAQVQSTVSGCKKVVDVKFKVNNDVDLDLSGLNLNCNGDGSGKINAVANFGTAFFSYSIDGGPFISSGSNYTFEFLSAGKHKVTLRDSKTCTDTLSITLSQPPALSVAINKTDITCFFDINGVTDKDGKVEGIASGGTLPYKKYTLLPNNVDNLVDGKFNGLRTGTYSVRIIDNNNCTAESPQVTLNAPTQIEITSLLVAKDANGFNLSCKDATDGEISVKAQGGNTPVSYIFSIAKSTDPNNPVSQIPGDDINPITFTSLGAATYKVDVTDSKGCKALPGTAIIVNPPAFNPGLVGINQAVCLGDTPVPIQELVPPFGGVGNYKFEWQRSTTGSNNDAEWLTIPGATSSTYDPAALNLTTTTYFRRVVQSVSPRTNTACETLGKDTKVEVTVNPIPVVSFQAPGDVCQNESFFITLTLQPGTGTAPIEYDYNDGSTSFLNLVGTDNTIIPISNFQSSATYTLTRVKDLNGCVSQSTPISTAVNIVKVNPAFDVLAPDAQCSGGTFSFQWNVETDVKYTWLWSDGQQDVINANSLPNGITTITHVFPAGSTQSSTVYPVRLQAENTLCIPKFSSKPVTVFPTIALNILPGKDTICSGEPIQFIDQSQGVDVGKWYYRPSGTTGQQDVKAGPASPITYVLENNTTNDPIAYEVVYEAANNEGCKDEYHKQIVVYRNAKADFDVGPVPPFSGGVSQVTFTNTSTPIDPTTFDYVWDFDDPKAAPPTESGVGPYTVEYYSAGVRNIVLKVRNLNAASKNVTCESKVIKQINVTLPALAAAFRVTPLASCFPTDLVVENLSPGADTFVWEIYNESGLVSNSNLRNPVFRILSPGKYDIYLTASYSKTNQTALAEKKGIEVFDNPTAMFEARPTPLYVPDTELQIFNSSQRANQYDWDFDDGVTSTEFQPKHTYTLEGKYMITLVAGYDNGDRDIDGDGIMDGHVVCYDTARQEIVALDGGFLKIPNAFTPNINGSTDGNGVPGAGSFNDVFLPITKGVEEFNMQIYDRWGTLVFETTDKNVGWDGYDRNHRLMPAGVYVYKLVMRLSNGQRTTKLGDVTLIR
jgi:gliding motility-associated-like protein